MERLLAGRQISPGATGDVGVFANECGQRLLSTFTWWSDECIGQLHKLVTSRHIFQRAACPERYRKGLGVMAAWSIEHIQREVLALTRKHSDVERTLQQCVSLLAQEHGVRLVGVPPLVEVTRQFIPTIAKHFDVQKIDYMTSPLICRRAVVLDCLRASMTTLVMTLRVLDEVAEGAPEESGDREEDDEIRVASVAGSIKV